MIAASPGTPERSRYLAIFDPKSVRPHEVYAADISAADLNLDIINGSLRDAVDMLGEINPKPTVRSLQPAAVLVAITPEQEPTAMTKIFQAVIPKHLGLVDLDRDTTLAYGDDLVRYPMTTAHYTLGWSSPSGIADVLEEIYRQQSTTEYSRADYVKIIDRKPARSVHAGKSLREGERAQSASAEENQETQQETQWSFQRSSQWDTQHYIQCFYSATSGSVGTQGNIMADEGFWIEVRNGAAELHFGIGGLDLHTASEVFRRWLDGARNFPDVGQWQKLII
ncbi:hypothetical protein [Corynebacterium pseudodiphtheriticum]|uniref:hypothetical protein n=1 Tax=Corynebacterium pseudodiphtheriticum TaxID=37637 RepID=UPI001F60C1AD|nr:hypothetical protein [Corynebacterium pseudodiphtheriticum]UNU76035.1 hypothetical protein HH207_10225 [Corynebacterium pseudodiphtheriticum]UNU76691.1 hypothetical protein HH208_01990 [Corynebacterium pseudodiphtheriticum]